MHRQNINFAKDTIAKIQRPRKQRGLFYKLARSMLIGLAIVFALLFALSYRAIFSQASLGQTMAKLPVISQIKTLFGGHSLPIEIEDDRINFLILGIGGAGHDGALLTDTMILASIKPSTEQIALISIPRDLLVKIPDNGWQRINHANAYGEINNYPGGGSALAAKTVEETFGVPIHYWVRVDFSGFKTLIDDIGGIDIYADRGFTDKEYPTDDYLVQTVTFEPGLQPMDGDRALIFARSRHGDNNEGSDFARGKRQQKILLAIKDKILNWKTLINPNRLYSIYDNVKQNVQTNIEMGRLAEMADLLNDLDYDKIEHYTMDDAPGGLLKSIITENGAQVLAPKKGDLSEVRDFVKNIFTVKDIFDSDIKVIIANGTTIEGLATYTGAALESWGFKIARLINSPRQDFEKTVIYDLTENGNEEVLKILKDRMGANATKTVPDFLQPALYKINHAGEQEKIEADFMVAAGTDQIQAIRAIEEWKQQQARIQTTTGGEENNINGEDGEKLETGN